MEQPASSFSNNMASKPDARTISRLDTQTRLSWEKEKHQFSWWGVQDGMAVLEVGCGPGFFSRQLLAWLPTSPLTCVDINQAFLEYARDLLSREAHRVRFVQASILAAHLPEQTFDVVFARFVFQHLSDPLAAAQAIWRLLKPGGKLIIIDSDDALFGMIHPAVPELPTLLELYGQAQTMRGGNRQMGRQLWRLLAQAGFLPRAFEAIAFHSDELGMEVFREHLDPERFVPLVKAKLLSEATFVQARASFERFLASRERFVMMLWLVAYGEKPSVNSEQR